MFKYVEERNSTVCVYNGSFALEVLKNLPLFLKMMNSLIEKLKVCDECFYDSNGK